VAEEGTITILNVAGARPNFVKIAPLMAAFAKRPEMAAVLVHTGQHYDDRMSHIFFDELGIPRPDVNLEVGSGSHGEQTAQIMMRFEPALESYDPDVVLVVGDVNSTIACALVAAKMHVPVAHVEAGLRSFDPRMPEEINRVLTDAISEFLFVTEPSGIENLRREGAADENIHFVGNVMIDALLANLEKARGCGVLERLGLRPRGYATLTLHRPANVDDAETLGRLMGAIRQIADDLPVVFPVHPRTRKTLRRFGLLAEEDADRLGGIRLLAPLGYLEFLALMAEARLILTDSGGIQEEATILKVPCLTLRAGTERPVTVDVGCNQVVGSDPGRILAAYRSVVVREAFTCGTPEKWDGRAAERIADVLVEALG